jgi:hypothetical protein
MAVSAPDALAAGENGPETLENKAKTGFLELGNP